MSADCLFVLQKCTNFDKLKRELSDYARDKEIGVWFTPHDALLECKQIELDDKTFLFEPTDEPGSISTGLLLVPDYYSINGKKPDRPFTQRAQILQELAKIGLQYASWLEIYISEDNPYLPDYTMYTIEPNEIMALLMREEVKIDRRLEPIPCICIRVIGS